MDEGRVSDMSRIMNNNPEMILKLSATSMAFSIAIAKLYEYKRDIMSELEKDYNYIQELEKAYIACSIDDSDFAERFSQVSGEVDKLLLKLDADNDRNR